MNLHLVSDAILNLCFTLQDALSAANQSTALIPVTPRLPPTGSRSPLLALHNMSQVFVVYFS